MASQQKVTTVDLERLQVLIKEQVHQLDGKSIVVVGDVGLDEYVLGEVRRISPEAPVPVLEVASEDRRLGLAANVAQNVVSLGGKAELVSVVGDDGAALQLKGLLQKQGVGIDHLMTDSGRPTIRKTRIIAEQHHIVRVDYEVRRYLEGEVEARLLARLSEVIPKADAVVIEDYAKGLLSQAAMQEVIRLGKKHGKKVLVDPHRTTPAHYYKGVDLMTPNRDEAEALVGGEAEGLRATGDEILRMGQALREKVQAERLVLTRGKEGMTLFDQDRIVHLPTYARQVFDVTGAGDTVIAALALAWAAGWSLEQACVLANFAAGVVVGKVGCVPCARADLLAYVDSFSTP